MSRLPSYPFRVLVYKNGTINMEIETHNYQAMAGAIAYREIALRRPNTKLVEIVVVLDETTPTNHLSVLTAAMQINRSSHSRGNHR